MDMRNGDLYPTREAAALAGVPDDQIAEVEPVIVTVKNGPFKGRMYERMPNGGLRRVTAADALPWRG
ncbi:MAG TPA: hypothetical protein DCQ64_12065 [Candidatus Rokubacteria bacterium]|nr:hypothetical protein [Candidatus Rokubacteria bacterium]